MSDDFNLADLSDQELMEQIWDDLYDGLNDEISEGVNILLERGWKPYKVLTEALVEGMRIVGIDLRGTAITRLANAGATTPEIASISGHSLQSVDNILKHYLVHTDKQASNAIDKIKLAEGI